MPCGRAHDHGADCDHGASGELGEEIGLAYSLYQRIDLDHLNCLNEKEENPAVKIFKPWEHRLDKEDVLESDTDEELLINIPFTGNVKLKGIIIVGGEEDTHPSKLRLFKNRPNMTFDEANTTPDQEFSLVRDSEGKVEYKTKIVTFSSVGHLTLHFPTNFGAESTRIYYIGLAGEWTKASRVGVVNAVYEVRPMVEDIQQDLQEGGVSAASHPRF